MQAAGGAREGDGVRGAVSARRGGTEVPAGGPLLRMPQKGFSGPNTHHCVTSVTFIFGLF